MFSRFLISSDRSGSGKTLITSGILRALSRKFKVRPFKAGPDFIDPGYLTKASKTPAINLDLWMMGENGVLKSLSRYSMGYDVAVIEGVMGLYDGVHTSFSSAQLSKVTSTPVILVMNCSNTSSTIGAIVKGLKEYENVDVRGVIFNKVGSDTHYGYCKESIPDGVEVLGRIPFNKELEVNSRHLGLLTVEDNHKVEQIIEKISKVVENNVDLDKLLEITRTSTIDFNYGEIDLETKKKIMAIAFDEGFSFYYKENLDLLKGSYNLVFFSPLENEEVTNADAIYLGGGYPELHLKVLESNSVTKKWLKRSSDRDIPILAECGGLMYLSENLIGERKYSMVGIYDIDIKVKDKLTIGYTTLKATRSVGKIKEGEIMNGHEFHVSSPVRVNEKEFVFTNVIGKGILNGKDGALVKNSLGTYSHFHFLNSGKKKTVVF
jgi:cobyrinic acid a,c-diamide synthase